MHRNAKLPGALQQRRIDRGTAHRDKAQRIRQLPAGFTAHDQRFQQLGNQNHAVRPAVRQHIEKRRESEACGAVEAQGLLLCHDDGGARAQRRMYAGNILQQCRQRQYTQVTGNFALLRRRHDGVRHRLHVRLTQAGAFRSAGGPRGKRNLAGARRQ